MFGKIPESIWYDRKFIQLDDTTKIVYLYLLTNKHRQQLGVYHLPIAYVIADTGIEERQVVKDLRILHGLGYAYYDSSVSAVLVTKYLEVNNHYNHNHIRGAFRKLKDIEIGSLRAPLLEIIERMAEEEEREMTEKEFRMIIKYLTDCEEDRIPPDCHPDAIPMPSNCHPIATQKDESDEEKQRKKEVVENSKEVLDYLNEVSGRSFKFTEQVKTNLRNRFKEGFTVTDLKKAVDGQVYNCRLNNVPQYEHPKTLFLNATNVERAIITADNMKTNDGSIKIADDDPINLL